MAKIWKEFLPAFARSGRFTDDTLTPPSIADLTAVVHQVRQDSANKKESGFGKARDKFFTFCQTMSDHSYLFSVFPDGDKYTSLFTGVVSSIVKVGAPQTVRPKAELRGSTGISES